MVSVLSTERRRNPLNRTPQKPHRVAPRSPYDPANRGLFGARVALKYKKASVKRKEYKRLKNIVPSLAGKKAVSKVRLGFSLICYVVHR